jgi:hypothetical protein
MEISIMDRNKSLLSLKQDLNSEGIILSFTGPFSQKVLEEVAEAWKMKLEIEKEKKSRIYNIFSVFVEMVQNVINYSDEVFNDSTEEISIRSGIVIIGKKDDRYYISSGNKILSAKVDTIKQKLDKISSMEKNELNRLFKHCLRHETPPPESKGAGLGFIEMARKSNSPLEYTFDTIDDSYSFFTLHASI